MAIIKRQGVGASVQTIPVWKSYFDNIGSSFITTSEDTNALYISIATAATLKLGFDNSGYCRPNTLTTLYNNTTTSLSVLHCSAADPCIATTCYSNRMFYFFIIDDTKRKWLIFYYELGTQKFFSFTTNTSTSSTFINLSSLTLIDINSLQPYSIGNSFPYTTQTNTIDYIDNTFLLSGSEVVNLDYDLKSCSSVTSNNIISFNNKNFFAPSSNILIPIET